MNEELELELHRRIDDWLIEWKNTPNHKPALIKGIRQSGKTHAIKKFVNNKKNYEVAIYINFWDNPDFIDAFEGRLDINTIITELSIKMPLPN